MWCDDPGAVGCRPQIKSDLETSSVVQGQASLHTAHFAGCVRVETISKDPTKRPLEKDQVAMYYSTRNHDVNQS